MYNINNCWWNIIAYINKNSETMWKIIISIQCLFYLNTNKMYYKKEMLWKKYS